MDLFYQDNDEVEAEIEQKTKEFVSFIENDRILKKFIKVFGITGPAARGQASTKGSDVDFYCISNYFHPRHEAYLKKRFKHLFRKIDWETSVLVFAPSILDKPDLMLYEFVNSGKVLYGELDYELGIEEVPKWEGVKLLEFRSAPFLCSDTEKLDYHYSNLLLGIGEAFLLLNEEYVADNFERRERVLKNEHLKGLDGFISKYKKAFKFRYENFDYESKRGMRQKGKSLLRQAWKTYMEEYYQTDYEEALRLLKGTKPLTLKEKVGHRFFHTWNHWKMFGDFRMCLLRHPYVRELVLIQDYLDDNDDEKRKELCMAWKATPRFWYPR